MNYGEHLQKEGWVVIPCLGEKVSMVTHNHNFSLALSKMPEYKNARDMVTNGTPFVKGGMAALGNPSSFHNSYVRTIRQWAHNAVLKQVFLPILEKDKELKFEQDIDRMLFRRPPATPSAESWHRDESLNAKEGDTIYGGWINLDTEPQYFSGCPQSHLEPDAMRRNQGFAKIDKKDYPKYNAMKQKIEIAPGHIFIFYERMVHEVLASKKKKEQCRLFLGWRTTKQNEPLVENLLDRLEEKAVMPIKSGQIPAMYSKMHWMFNRVSKSGKLGQRDQLAEWSKNFKPQCTESRKMLSGADKGKQWTVVHQHMLSLKDYNLDGGRFIPAYNDDEIALLFPNRKWRVLQIESLNDYEVIEVDNGVKKKKKTRRKVAFEDDEDDDDCEEFEKHVKEKDYEYVREWLRKEGLSIEELCRGKTPQPPPEVIDLIDSSLDESDSDDDEEEIPPPPETEICPVITTVDMLTKEFVELYAPWKSRGITRQQNVRKGKATLCFWFKGDHSSGQWAYGSNIGWLSKFNIHKIPTVTGEIEHEWLRKRDKYVPPRIYYEDGRTDTPPIFWDSPLNKEVDGPLKMYVQVKEGPAGKYYAIRGEKEMFDMHDIKTILPKNYMISKDRKRFTAANKPIYKYGIGGFFYSDHIINVGDLMAFQLAVNKINEKYRNVELAKESPYLTAGFVPPTNNQILGWHVEANFPDQIKKIIQEHDLKPLGACGPRREKSANATVWSYRFNINGMYNSQINAMLRILCPIFPNIFCKQIFLRKGGSGFEKLNEFIKSDAIVAVGAWGTPKGRSGHERLMLKRKSMEGNWLEIYDPWMQGTRKHKHGFILIENFLKDYNFEGKWRWRKIDRPAEQANGEGSCVAMSLSRAITVAESGQLSDITERIPEWIPVLIKMLAVKFNTKTKATNFLNSNTSSLVGTFSKLKLKL
eukprot:g14655.t1